MQTLLFILIIVALVIFVRFMMGLWRLKSYNRFQNNMKKGDPCYFYLEEEKIVGVIDDFLDNETVIIGSELGMHLRTKADIYPFTI